MSMLQLCTYPGCSTWTIGRSCVEHEPHVDARVFPRGRPFLDRPAGGGLETAAVGLVPAHEDKVRSLDAAVAT